LEAIESSQAGLEAKVLLISTLNRLRDERDSNTPANRSTLSLAISTFSFQPDIRLVAVLWP
jgi:hypothetical protein